MSTFTALNLSEDEVDLEEHTRELQIEESFKIFQRALQLQKERRYEEADAEYAALFRLDVVSGASAYASPTIQNLKYLCFRNRGLYKFTKLAETGQASRNELLSVVDDLVTALEFGEGDTILTDVLYGLYCLFGDKRLERFALEYELMKFDNKNGSEDELSFVRGKKYALPHTLEVLSNYREVLESIGDLKFVTDSPESFVARNRIELLKKVSTGRYAEQLAKLKEHFEKRDVAEFEVVDVELAIDDEDKLSWNDILVQLQSILPKPRGRSKCYDNYLLTADPVERVRFKVMDGETTVHEVKDLDEEMPDAEEEPEEPPREPEEPEETPEKEEEALEKTEETAEEVSEKAEKAEVRKRSMRSRTDGASEEEIARNMAAFNEILDSYVALLKTKPLFNAPLPAEEGILDELAREFPEWGYYECKVFDEDFNEEEDYSVAEMLTTSTVNNYGGSVDGIADSQRTLRDLIGQINDSHTHVAQLRVQILEKLFLPFSEGERSPVLCGKLSKDALSALKLFLDASDLIMFEQFSSQLTLGEFTEKDVLRALHIAVTVVEISTDTFAATDIELRRLKHTEKAKIADLKAVQTAISERLSRWTKLIEELKELAEHLGISYEILECRRIWANIIALQHEHPVNSAKMIAWIKSFQEYVEKVDESLEITYANYEHIPKLNVKSVSLELSKIGVTDKFSQITSAESDSKERRDILEGLLMLSDPPAEIQEMKRFLDDSSEELHMKLWHLLLKEYSSCEDLSSLTSGLEAAVGYLTSTLLQNTTQDASKRRKMTARVVFCLGSFLKLFMDAFSANHWTDFAPHDTSFLPSFLKLVRLLNGFVLCMDISGAGIRDCLCGNARKTAAKVFDITVMAYTALCLYVTHLLPPNDDPSPVNDLISVVHEFLGSRSICDGAGGVFLDYSETTLLDLGWPQSDRDVFQIVNCRYHIKVSAGLFTPVDHGTTKVELSEFSALKLNGYAVPLCFQKRNPMFNLPRNDMKVLLDKLQQVLGDPDPANEIVAKNTTTLEFYLNLSDFGLRMIRLAFNGILGVHFSKPTGTNYASAGETGLYYTQGVIALNLFKIRKRTMQGRSTELEAVVKIFTSDVVSGSGRFESWMFLAQTYAYMVEDDVIWTSDKLNTPDKKYGTAVLQKKAILCYLMAIDVYMNMAETERRANGDVSAILWASFAKELYNATFKPMEGLAFSVLPVPMFRKREGGKAFTSTEQSDITTEKVLKILEVSLKTAIGNSHRDWAAFYYLSKVQSKLKRPPETCLKSLLESCRLAKKAGSSTDPVIEPQCRLPWLLFKCVLRRELTIERALEWMAMDPLTAPPKEGGEASGGEAPPKTTDFFGFARTVIEVLRAVKAADKKNWHHKPHHRIAQIQFAVFDDPEAAKTEMNSIVNLKTTVRTLVNIWKPEHERPGKHFVYVYDYIVYYAEILFKQKDLDSLFTFTKKLRRLGSSMVNQPQAWDQVVPKVCNLVKWLLKVPPNFVETHITDLNFKDFMSVSLYIVQRVKTDTEVPEECELYYYLLSEMHEFRKMTNGFSPTGLVDDTYYTIFFFLFVRYKIDYDGEPVHPEVPAAQLNKQRVARRDIVPIGGDIMTNMAKKMEKIKAKVTSGTLQERIQEREEEDREMGLSFSLVDEEDKESVEWLMRRMAAESKLEGERAEKRVVEVGEKAEGEAEGKGDEKPVEKPNGKLEQPDENLGKPDENLGKPDENLGKPDETPNDKPEPERETEVAEVFGGAKPEEQPEAAPAKPVAESVGVDFMDVDEESEPPEGTQPSEKTPELSEEATKSPDIPNPVSIEVTPPKPRVGHPHSGSPPPTPSQVVEIESGEGTPIVLDTPVPLSDESAEFHTPMEVFVSPRRKLGEREEGEEHSSPEEPSKDGDLADIPEPSASSPSSQDKPSDPKESALLPSELEKPRKRQRLTVERPATRSSRSRGNVEFVELD